MAWPKPPLLLGTATDATNAPGSQVVARQCELRRAMEATLAAVAEDVRLGLLETVGISSHSVDGERCAVELELPSETDLALVARAIDQENVEAWCENGKVRVGIGPWHSTKDVDQVVLCVTKVVHVLLGMHAAAPQQGMLQRAMASVAQVLSLQQQASRSGDAE